MSNSRHAVVLVTVNMETKADSYSSFFNILADNDVREGLKAFSDWPTFPQLYTNGELIGGLDIVSPNFFSSLVEAPVSGRYLRHSKSCCTRPKLTAYIQVREELESDPEFFKPFSAAKVETAA